MKESGQLSRILRQWLPDSKVGNSIIYPLNICHHCVHINCPLGRLLGRWRVQIDGFGKHSFRIRPCCHCVHRGIGPAPLGTAERFEEAQTGRLQQGQGPLPGPVQQTFSKGHNAHPK